MLDRESANWNSNSGSTGCATKLKDHHILPFAHLVGVSDEKQIHHCRGSEMVAKHRPGQIPGNQKPIRRNGFADACRGRTKASKIYVSHTKIGGVPAHRLTIVR